MTNLGRITTWAFGLIALSVITLGGFAGPVMAQTPPVTVASVTISNIRDIDARATIVVNNPDGAAAITYYRHRATPSEAWSSIRGTSTRNASFSFSLTGLTAETEYEVVASRSPTFLPADTVSTTFTTGSGPYVSAVSVGSIGETGATVSVTISDPNGQGQTVYLRYRTATGGSWTSLVALTSTGTATRDLAALGEATQYEVQASLDNTYPSGISASANFATLTPEPYVSGMTFSGVDRELATIRVAIAFPRGSRTVYLRYRTTPGGPWSGNRNVRTAGASAGFTLSGLTVGTEYEVQASMFSSYPTTAQATATFTTLPPPTPFPAPSTPPAQVRVQAAPSGYLGTLWVEIGVSGEDSGYQANDYGGLVHGNLPGQLFADGRPRNLKRFVLHDTATPYITLNADFAGNSSAHRTGDALKWTRLQVRSKEGDIIASANIWDAYTPCSSAVICLNLQSQHESVTLSSLDTETVAVDFFDGEAEIAAANPGGRGSIVFFAEYAANQIACDSDADCYVGGNYPDRMLEDPAHLDWQGSVTINPTSVTLTAELSNLFVFEGWERFDLNLRDREGEVQAKIPLDSAVSSQASNELVLTIPGRYSPLDNLEDQAGQLIALQFEDSGWRRLLQRTPGGMIAGQIMLTLFAGGLVAVRFRGTLSPGREIVIMGALAFGSMILPAFGLGSLFWTGGVVLLCLIGMGAVFFLRVRA